VKTVSDKVVWYSLAYLTVQKIVGGGRPTSNFGETDPPSEMPIPVNIRSRFGRNCI